VASLLAAEIFSKSNTSIIEWSMEKTKPL